MCIYLFLFYLNLVIWDYAENLLIGFLMNGENVKNIELLCFDNNKEIEF